MTDIVLPIARLLLIAVFLVAGIAKLADLAGSRRAVAGFGVPSALAGPLGLLLPLVELAVAIALVPAASAWWGALGALLLLLLFIAGIGVNLARGRAPDCHCFGQIHSEPVGWGTLIRNVLLAAVAAVILAPGPGSVGPGLLDWLPGLTLGERVTLGAAVAVTAVLGAQLWLLYQMYNQNRRLLARLAALETGRSLGGSAAPETQSRQGPGPAIGSPAPAFALPDLGGRIVTLADLLEAGRPVMLLFTDPSCGPCSALLPEIGSWQRSYAGQVTIAVLSTGSVEANALKSSEHGVTRLLLQERREIEEAYEVPGTPGAVVIQSDGTIAGPAVGGAESIRALLRGVLGPQAAPLIPLQERLSAPTEGARRETAPPVAAIGEPAPDVPLIDLMGREVRLSEFRGRDTLLLFWNSGCGFCQQMLPDLKAWEAGPPEGAPELVIILPYQLEGNQVVPFRSPVLIDREQAAALAFEVGGTPMAVLLDAEGRVASDVAAGAEAVFSLANRTQEPVQGLAG